MIGGYHSQSEAAWAKVLNMREPYEPDPADVIHISCCEPRRALCGVTVDGDLLDDDEEPDAPQCYTCLELDESEVPCGVPFCRRLQALRRWWANRGKS